MSSPFEQAIAAADQTIQQTMMSEWLIGGKPYPATFDEAPLFLTVYTQPMTELFTARNAH